MPAGSPSAAPQEKESVMFLDRSWVVMFTAVFPIACYQGFPHDATAIGGTTGSSETANDDAKTDDPSDGDGDDTSGAASGTDGSEGESGTGSVPEPTAWARGISLVRVEANQGVAIALFENGSLVEPNERNADLVRERTTVIRAYWDLEEDFEPRMIDAHLRLATQEDDVEVLVQTLYVDGPPRERDLDGTFTWILPPEAVRPDLSFSVELHEIEGTPPSDVAVTPPRVPAEGEAPLGVSPDDMVLRVVFIPVQHTTGGGVQLTPANQTKVAERMLAEHPVESVEITWREPWVVSGQLVSLDDGWDILSTARAQDGAAPNVYYHLLLDRDNCCANNGQWGWSGIGGVANDSPNAANWGGRDAMSKVNANGEWGTGVIVHELGHNHGRHHAPCGNVAGADQGYPTDPPHTEAGIGVQGYDIVAGALYNPFPNDPPQGQWDRPYKDRMSYCSPSWWSDYNWQHIVQRLRLLTSWDTNAFEPSMGLRAFVAADGELTWSVVPLVGAVDPPLPTDVVVRLRRGDAVQAELTPHVVEVSEGGGRFFGVALPPESRDFDHVEADVGASTKVTPRHAIRHLDRL
jgi:hypothetical protein